MSNHYDPITIAFLSDIWGDGFMSPGGGEEASLVVKGLDINGAKILDIGSGSGAIAVLLVEKLGAASVIGIDVEEPVCSASSERIKRLGLQNKDFTYTLRLLVIELLPLPIFLRATLLLTLVFHL